MWCTQKRSLPTVLSLMLTLGPAASGTFAADRPASAKPDGVIVHDGNGSVGVFMGNATGFIGSVGPKGTEGVYIGPDGRPRRIRPTPGQRLPMDVPVLTPGGFDPFAFAFGGGPGPVTFRPSQVPSFDLDAARRDFRRGDIRGALRLADEALRAWPDDLEAHQTRALALFALGRFDEAGRAARRVLEDGAAWEWPAVSPFFASSGDYLDHFRSLQRAVRQRPGSPDMQWLLAYHGLLLGRPEMTRGALRGVIAARPTDTLARDLLESLPPDAISGNDAP